MTSLAGVQERPASFDYSPPPSSWFLPIPVEFSMLSYIVLLCAAWITWNIVRLVSAPSSHIDNLPGHVSPSWITGTCPFRIQGCTRCAQTLVSLQAIFRSCTTSRVGCSTAISSIMDLSSSYRECLAYVFRGPLFLCVLFRSDMCLCAVSDQCCVYTTPWPCIPSPSRISMSLRRCGGR